ncbi:MAG: response regulator [Azospirillaceae bacterium]
MDKGASIVVVDDEPDIRDTFAEYLTLNGYQVTAVESAAALRRHLAEGGAPDLIILDLAMPGEDGLSLARHLKENSAIAIIMVTGAGEVIDRIIGLEIGADDYLAKPVDLRELLARVKAVLRRTRGRARAVGQAGGNEVSFGRCRLNLDTRKLYDGEGREIALTAMEFDLLKAFAENPNRVLTRDQLLDLAHNKDWEPFDRSIDIRITRIRRKIESDPSKPSIIRTVRGAGYMFASDG